MPTLVTMIGGWLALNTAVFGALMLRRPRPHLRVTLFQWAVSYAPHNAAPPGIRRGLQRHP